MPRYECDRCGACCRGRLIVEVYHLDVLREPLLLGADIGAWTKGKTPDQLLAALEDEYKCLVIAGNRPCKFLDNKNLCTIYPTRPNDCVAMQAGDEQCQRARESEELPPLEPVAGETR